MCTQLCRGTHSTHWKQQLQSMQSQIQLERSFPFISTGTTITAQKGHEIEGIKANRTRAQLLQEINSPVLSIAAARGHCELAAADGEKVFSSEAAHCQQSTLTCLMREVRIAYVLLRLLSSVSTQLPAGSAVCTSS